MKESAGNRVVSSVPKNVRDCKKKDIKMQANLYSIPCPSSADRATDFPPYWAYLEKMDTNLGGFVFV